MPKPNETLEKRLGALDVYALATGATLSAGFFLLPGLAAVEAGPALVLAYVLAAVPLVPAILCKVELMTAMPRAGGIYYYLDRSLGPAAGTIGGLGTWVVLMLKVAFALIGMGAYLGIFFPELPIVPVALGLAAVAGAVNIVGAKLSGGIQIGLLAGLLLILGIFILLGVPRIEPGHFGDFLGRGWDSIFSTAGLVYVSYAGLTKIAGVAEEVADPERNLPMGTFAALGTALVVYGAGTAVIVGVVPMDQLQGDLTSVATAGGELFGTVGVVGLSVAALLAFAAVTNAGTMSASRYPLAMSRDHILPEALQVVSEQGTPVRSIALTVGVMSLVLVFLDPLEIAKLASAFKLLVFSMVCLAVVVMRESRIEEYDPGYRSPAYPWLQIAGIVLPLVFIGTMGWGPVLFSLGLIGVGLAWYAFYTRKRVVREGAVFHIFERLGRQRDKRLESELREILKEKGLRETDPFAQMVGDAPVLDLPDATSFERVVSDAAGRLADRLPVSEAKVASTFLEETELGIAPVSHGAALPHLRLQGVDRPHLLIVRSREGLILGPDSELGESGASGDRIHALFFLLSPADESRQHLRMLARLAEHVEREEFLDRWRAARDEGELKEILVEEEKSVSLRVEPDRPAGQLIGRPLGEARLPDGIRVVLIRRGGQVSEAADDAVLRQGDQVTLLGEPEAIDTARERFGA